MPLFEHGATGVGREPIRHIRRTNGPLFFPLSVAWLRRKSQYSELESHKIMARSKSSIANKISNLQHSVLITTRMIMIVIIIVFKFMVLLSVCP